MKNLIILFIALFFNSQLLLAQISVSQQMEEFIQQKGNDFEAAYEKKDLKAYNALLSEYLSMFEKLAADEKKQHAYLLSKLSGID